MSTASEPLGQTLPSCLLLQARKPQDGSTDDVDMDAMEEEMQMRERALAALRCVA